MAAAAVKALLWLQGKPFLSAGLLLTGLGSGAVAVAEADPRISESLVGTGIGTTLITGGHGIVRSTRAIHAVRLHGKGARNS